MSKVKLEKSNRKLQQLRMPDELHRALKLIAVVKKKDLQDIYDLAIEHLLERRKTTRIDYLASPKNGQLKSIWILQQVDLCAKDAAAQDQVALNRLNYTAFVHYAAHEKKVFDSDVFGSTSVVS